MIRDNTYKMQKYDKQTLRSLGFRYDVKTSDEETTNYLYRFPVVKYKKHTTLECELLVDTENGNIEVNVYDNQGEIFPAFYYKEYGDYAPILKIINEKILAEFNKLHIVEVNS